MKDLPFTVRLRTALGASRGEARRLGHPYIGTEHILLGLLRDSDGVIAAVLRKLDVAPEDLRQRVEAIIVSGTEATIGPDVPYTSRGKKVLELTIEEAVRDGAPAADTVHLLSALCAEKNGLAAQVLSDAGLTTELAREEGRRLAGVEPAVVEQPESKSSGGWLFTAAFTALGLYFLYSYYRVHGLAGFWAL